LIFSGTFRLNATRISVGAPVVGFRKERVLWLTAGTGTSTAIELDIATADISLDMPNTAETFRAFKFAV
jgi:hypothetical protein